MEIEKEFRPAPGYGASQVSVVTGTNIIDSKSCVHSPQPCQHADHHQLSMSRLQKVRCLASAVQTDSSASHGTLIEAKGLQSDFKVGLVKTAVERL